MQWNFKNTYDDNETFPNKSNILYINRISPC